MRTTPSLVPAQTDPSPRASARTELGQPTRRKPCSRGRRNRGSTAVRPGEPDPPTHTASAPTATERGTSGTATLLVAREPGSIRVSILASALAAHRACLPAASATGSDGSGMTTLASPVEGSSPTRACVGGVQATNTGAPAASGRHLPDSADVTPVIVRIEPQPREGFDWSAALLGAGAAAGLALVLTGSLVVMRSRAAGALQ